MRNLERSHIFQQAIVARTAAAAMDAGDAVAIMTAPPWRGPRGGRTDSGCSGVSGGPSAAESPYR